MDNLTHGLLGLAVGALRKPDGPRGLSPTDRATLVASVLAAELPDLDGLWPSGNDILHSMAVHRGPSHALLFSPLWAGLAAFVATRVFKGARLRPVFVSAWAAVVFAHLAADAWTGWGTRLLLPFSDARVTFDWMMVVDPLFTVPLLVGGLVALAWRRRWRLAILAGAAVASAYLGARIATRAVLHERVALHHADAARITVFPDWFGISRWRYVAEVGDAWALGTVPIDGAPAEHRRVEKSKPLPPELASNPTVAQAIAWARFPSSEWSRRDDGGAKIQISDLRYHLYGEPTLGMRVELSPRGEVLRATLERPVKPRELFARWRKGP